MASYIENNLASDEEIICRAHPSWWYHIGQILLAIICFILAIVITELAILGVLLIIWMIISHISTELALTNKRVIAKFGFIRRSVVDVRLNKIESVSFEQGIIGRILNFGSIVVSGAGNSTPIPGISKPNIFKNTVNNYLADIEQNKA